MINEINFGDCLELMNGIADESVDMILCDLPYGTTQCSWDSVINFSRLWIQYERIIKSNGAIVLTASQPFTSRLIMSNIDRFKYSMVWEKSKATGFLNAKKRPLVAHEDIVVFCKGTPPYYPQMSQGEAYNKGVRKKQTKNDVYGDFKQAAVKSEGLRYPRSVVYFKTAESEGDVIHKTQKPIALMEYLIKTYTKIDEVILDNCSGSGSTAIACLKTNRKYICIENDKHHFENSINRVELFKAHPIGAAVGG